MKTKRAVQKKAMPLAAPSPEAPATDSILDEMGALYRERLRAHYNGDLAALAKIDQRIEILKGKL